MRSRHGSIRSRARLRAARPAVVALALIVGATTGVSGASAYWTGGGSGAATAGTASLAAAVDLAVPETAVADVPVSWSDGVGGIAPTGYIVTRQQGELTEPACGTGPSTLLPSGTCIDTAVPDGTYRYLVTAVYRSWTAPSAWSPPVTVTSPPNEPTQLGTAASYSVLAATAIVNTGDTTVSGDLGVSPGTSISGIGPDDVGGGIHAGDASAADAHADLAGAYDSLSGLEADAEITGDLGGLVLTPGIYHSTAALALTGTLTLDARDVPDAIFVLQTDAAFNTAAGSIVEFINGASAANVFWVVAGASGTGANSFLSGTILSAGAITIGASTELIGRALSLDAVTLAAATIRFTDSLPPSVGIDGGATVITTDTTATITGTSSAPASSPLTVTVGGQSLSTTIGSDGTWSVTTSPLPAGSHDVIAKVRDADGNGGTATQTLIVDVNPAPVMLGTAGRFSVLAGTSVVNTGVTSMTGDLGVSPGTTITGVTADGVGGTVHAGDGIAATAQGDLLAALDEASARAPHSEIVGDLGGQTFRMGVHHSTTALALTGTLTLDARGDPGAIFIFQTDAAFNTAAGSAVELVGGAQAANVFWIVSGAAGTGADSSLVGAILARGAVTLGANTALTGQALSRDAVTLASDTLTGIGPAT